jgi:hypothetical protein
MGNPEQLRMFMTPREILDEYKPYEAEYLPVKDPKTGRPVEKPDEKLGTSYEMESDKQLWDRKLQESRQNGLMADLKEHGVEVPVSLNPETRQVTGGHHRIITAFHLHPDQFIPVMHFPDTGSAGFAEYQLLKKPENQDLFERSRQMWD